MHAYRVLPRELQQTPPDFRGVSKPRVNFWGPFLAFSVAAALLSVLCSPLFTGYLPPLIIFETGALAAAGWLHESRKPKADEVFRSKINALWREQEKRNIEEAEVLTRRLLNLTETYRQELHALPEVLRHVQGYLTKAKEEFNDGAYGPFWDNIETAARELGDFNQTLRSMSASSAAYSELLRDRSHSFPPLLDESSGIPDPRPYLETLRRLVRQGQRNYEFASIWEHRQTREAIIDGFENLGESIDSLGGIIELSVSSLQSTLSSGLASIEEGQNHITAGLDNFAEKVTSGQQVTVEAIEASATRISNEQRLLRESFDGAKQWKNGQ